MVDTSSLTIFILGLTSVKTMNRHHQNIATAAHSNEEFLTRRVHPESIGRAPLSTQGEFRAFRLSALNVSPHPVKLSFRNLDICSCIIVPSADADWTYHRTATSAFIEAVRDDQSLRLFDEQRDEFVVDRFLYE